MSVVKLESGEVEMAVSVGCRRRIKAIEGGFSGKAGVGPGTWDMDVEGAAAELAFCKDRGVYWPGSLDSFKAPDAGGKFQIRQSKYKTGKLIVRPKDRPGDTYVLVTGRIPTFYVCGYIDGVSAMQEGFWQDLKNGRPPMWFVPQRALHKFPPLGEKGDQCQSQALPLFTIA
tara:strand:+ start:3873 stop:4388 length:516 start_codon:yes stop_codon:yes gene_type:complete